MWAWLVRQKNLAPGTPVHVSAGGRYAQEVVGESHYQLALRKVAASTSKNSPPLVVHLIPDPRNKHDRNAIMVCHPQFGLLGHIPRETAAEVAPLLQSWLRDKKFASCNGRLVGGYGRNMSFGIWLDVDFETLQ